MMLVVKNGNVYTPDPVGKKDLLIGGGKILAIEERIELPSGLAEVVDAQGKIITPGLIDQHIHLTGAGGKYAFASMTPEINVDELVACGTTTVVGLLGTDGVTHSLQALYAKVKALEQQGISAYMLTSNFGYPPRTMLESVLEDIVFIDKVIGCKIAISDERGSFPTENELLKLLREVHVGGMLAGKGGILHIHLGGLETRMDILLNLVKIHHFPIRHISPTHVGRTKELFEQAIEFAKLGGMIDISTGGTKFDMPHKQVLYALKKGVPIENITFSSDGNAGMAKNGENAELILYKAPVDLNLKQVILLIQEGGMPIGDAFKLITTNPARNLSLKHKGKISVGCDADLCFFNSDFVLTDVFSKGKKLMTNRKLITNH